MSSFSFHQYPFVLYIPKIYLVIIIFQVELKPGFECQLWLFLVIFEFFSSHGIESVKKNGLKQPLCLVACFQLSYCASYIQHFCEYIFQKDTKHDCENHWHWLENQILHCALSILHYALNKKHKVAIKLHPFYLIQKQHVKL